MRPHPPLALCAAGLATLLAACPRGTDTATPTPTTAAATRPKLVVLVVIDQLPSWSFDRDRDDLAGGIAGLLDRGALWPKARYPYATTNTAPGHATIGSGTTPSEHGIIANRWYVEGQRVGVDRDDAVAQFGVVDGARHRGGASAHHLQVPGIADALHAAAPAGKAVAIAWKPRAAVLMLGQHPDLALWFDAEQGAMTTSTAYADRLPAWVAPLAAAHPPSALLQPWHADDAEALARMTGRGDDQDGEGDPAGLGARFPTIPAPRRHRSRRSACCPRPTACWSTPQSRPSTVSSWAATRCPICWRCRSRRTTTPATRGARNPGNAARTCSTSIAGSHG
ncbi:MAG: alkaline phosphatase family protein [Deltaproteobacteria bacterium]|nr:alkaline phosphatase family protein [Deltaproteobacteria bacterium]